MKSLYEGGMKTLLDKSLHFPYYGNKSIYPCFWAQRQNSVKKNSDIYWQVTKNYSGCMSFLFFLHSAKSRLF